MGWGGGARNNRTEQESRGRERRREERRRERKTEKKVSWSDFQPHRSLLTRLLSQTRLFWARQLTLPRRKEEELPASVWVNAVAAEVPDGRVYAGGATCVCSEGSGEVSLFILGTVLNAVQTSAAPSCAVAPAAQPQTTTNNNKHLLLPLT